jgi:hypothetical protein
VTRFGYYRPNTPSSVQQLFSVANDSYQSLNPAITGGASFDPGSESFGFYSTWPFFGDRQAFSDDALNTWESNAVNRHKVRVYPLKATDGAVVPNAYVVAMEESTSGYDYQDIVVIVRNVQPAGTNTPVLAPQGWLPSATK